MERNKVIIGGSVFDVDRESKFFRSVKKPQHVFSFSLWKSDGSLLHARYSFAARKLFPECAATADEERYHLDLVALYTDMGIVVWHLTGLIIRHWRFLLKSIKEKSDI